MSKREMDRAFRTLGVAIKAAREELGVSQEDLARRAQIGASSLRQLETGSFQGPSLLKVVRVLRLLDLSMSTMEPLWQAAASTPMKKTAATRPARRRTTR